MIRIDSLEEAISSATRCPAADDEVVEVRRVQEMEDFSSKGNEAAG